MSRILLINPRMPGSGYLSQVEQFPNGALLLIGTNLKNNGHDVKLIHMMADGIGYYRLQDIIRSYKPDIVGLTANTFQSRSLRETAQKIKEVDKNIKVVAGGCHISALIVMNHVMQEDYPNIDYFICGEGDYAIENIIKNDKIGPIIYPEPLKELDIPFVDMDLIDIKRFKGSYPLGPSPSMFVMASRGCPFNCTFCSRSVFGKTVRHREPVAVVDEVEMLATDWGIKEIFFHDDTFNLKREWAEEILHLIIKRELNKKLCFRTPCRVNKKLVDSDLLKLMYEAGFWLIFYGVESGNQNMLDRMKKGTTLKEIKRAFKLTSEAGIKTEASFIVGLPGETEETIADSIALWKDIKPDWASFTRAIPFPGTEIYYINKQSGHLLINSFDEIVMNKVLCRTEALTAQDIDNYAIKLQHMVSRKKLWHVLKNPFKYGRLLKL